MDDEKVDVTGWARDLERRHAWVLHRSTLAVGPVERYFTGEEHDRFLSEIDGQPVMAPVLKLGTGHALLAVPANFIELGAPEADLYMRVIDRLRESVITAVNEAIDSIASKRQSMPDLPIALIVSAVRAQLHALEATARVPEENSLRPSALQESKT